MEHRPQTLVACLKAGFLVSLFAWAANVAAQEVQLPAETRARLEQGKALQAEGARLRDQAEQVRLREDEACARKFLVNDCRHDARERYLEQIRRARALEAEGGALERQARQEERELKRQQQEAEAATQARELPLRQQEQESLRQSREAERERRLLEKEAKAREGARTQAERRRRQEEKQAEHARKVHERMERARQQGQGGSAGPEVPRQP